MNLHLKSLIKNSKQCVAVDYNLFLLEFEALLILVEVEGINDDKEYLLDEFYNRELRMKVDADRDKDHLERLRIKKVTLSDYEYLGNRQDSFIEDEPKSICNKLYYTLKLLYNFDINSVKKYNLDLNDGYGDSGGGFCPGEPNYIFQIEIKNDFLELFSSKNFFNKDISNPTPPIFYWNFIHRYKRLEDSQNISILQTNTKVRRIGYFKLLRNYFIKNSKVPKNRLNNRFEDFIEENNKNDFLKEHDLKGVIKKTKRGTSAKPYIELAQELELINPINRVIVPGKSLKIYQVLTQESNKENEIFNISELDKIFFLHVFLKKDFLYLSVLLEFIFIHERTSYKSINNNFDDLLINRLEEFHDQIKHSKNYKVQKQIKNIGKRIRDWEKPRKYLEHVLMPRINWLHDLELIQLDKNNNITLKEKGKKLFSHLCFWNDINYQRIISPNSFLDRFYIHMFDDIYSNRMINEYSDQFINEVINKTIDKYLKESFNFFQTLAPNRVTSSQAITYTIYKAYIVEDLAIGKKYVQNYLESDNQTHFIYKYQRQYNDGYIQLK